MKAHTLFLLMLSLFIPLSARANGHDIALVECERLPSWLQNGKDDCHKIVGNNYFDLEAALLCRGQMVVTSDFYNCFPVIAGKHYAPGVPNGCKSRATYVREIYSCLESSGH